MSRKSASLRDLFEAARLTRAGRLAEATAAIQRNLRRQWPADASANDLAGRVIDAQFSIVEDELIESERPAARGGSFVSASYGNQAGTRPYKLYVPAGYAGDPLPLVVMLHGCTQTPDDFAAGTRMNSLADERQCIVLYPAQTPAANRSRCWNWFQRGDQGRGQGEPAIIAGMTRECMTRYGIDARRVYVAGLSAGGAMAAVMGAAYPDLFAAVGIHSGLAVGTAHDVPSAFAAMRGTPSAPNRARVRQATRPVPTILFHGDTDTTVHPRNSEQVIRESVEPSAASRSVERGQAPAGHAYTRTTYTDPQGRPLFEHWVVHGAGHAWSGGSAQGSFTDPRGPDAAREMLRFFYQQGLPDPLP